MKLIKNILCACVVVTMMLSMSVSAFAANGAQDGTGPNPIHQKLKDGSGGGKGGGKGGGSKDGTGPLKDGSGGGINCPYLP
ncbi:hypothetical protein LJC64_05535 [Ruminococcaceae bacterium OttesenSCG-928-A11]|nr:hypothetical protein [Ruminococcaceae bacterium OttesenSCG-928-A11]